MPKYLVTLTRDAYLKMRAGVVVEADNRNAAKELAHERNNNDPVEFGPSTAWELLDDDVDIESCEEVA
jgi:hypothetical protein